MIDIEEFENFMNNNKKKLYEYGIDVVRLHAKGDVNKYRAVEFVTKPIDEEYVPSGYLRSQIIVDKYNISLSVENFGRDEGETILKRSFSIVIDEFDEKKMIDAMEKLRRAENEFYSVQKLSHNAAV